MPKENIIINWPTTDSSDILSSLSKIQSGSRISPQSEKHKEEGRFEVYKIECIDPFEYLRPTKEFLGDLAYYPNSLTLDFIKGDLLPIREIVNGERKGKMVKSKIRNERADLHQSPRRSERLRHLLSRVSDWLTPGCVEATHDYLKLKEPDVYKTLLEETKKGTDLRKYGLTDSEVESLARRAHYAE